MQNYNCHVILYGRKTWSLTLKQKCMGEVFENIHQRKTPRRKREEVARSRRKYLKMKESPLQLKFSYPGRNPHFKRTKNEKNCQPH
jgi:hypothetical protein